MFGEKKAQQLFGLPFVFIVSLMIIALILASSIYIIKKFSCRQDQIQVSLFISDLKNEIKKTFYTSRGSRVIFKSKLLVGCSSIEYVCLALTEKSLKGTSNIGEERDELIREIYRWKGERKQLFFYPARGLVNLGISQAHNILDESYNTYIELEENPLCFNAKKEIKIILTNEGRSISISRG